MGAIEQNLDRPVERARTTPKWISLREWAKKEYGDHTPHINTLLKWVHTGRIQPQPEKHGALWRVRPHAEYKAD